MDLYASLSRWSKLSAPDHSEHQAYSQPTQSPSSSTSSSDASKRVSSSSISSTPLSQNFSYSNGRDLNFIPYSSPISSVPIPKPTIYRKSKYQVQNASKVSKSAAESKPPFRRKYCKLKYDLGNDITPISSAPVSTNTVLRKYGIHGTSDPSVMISISNLPLAKSKSSGTASNTHSSAQPSHNIPLSNGRQPRPNSTSSNAHSHSQSQHRSQPLISPIEQVPNIRQVPEATPQARTNYRYPLDEDDDGVLFLENMDSKSPAPIQNQNIYQAIRHLLSTSSTHSGPSHHPDNIAQLPISNLHSEGSSSNMQQRHEHINIDPDSLSSHRPQASLTPQKSLTTPYKPNYNAQLPSHSHVPNYQHMNTHEPKPIQHTMSTSQFLPPKSMARTQSQSYHSPVDHLNSQKTFEEELLLLDALSNQRHAPRPQSNQSNHNFVQNVQSNNLPINSNLISHSERSPSNQPSRLSQVRQANATTIHPPSSHYSFVTQQAPKTQQNQNIQRAPQSHQIPVAEPKSAVNYTRSKYYVKPSPANTEVQNQPKARRKYHKTRYDIRD